MHQDQSGDALGRLGSSWERIVRVLGRLGTVLVRCGSVIRERCLGGILGGRWNIMRRLQASVPVPL